MQERWIQQGRGVSRQDGVEGGESGIGRLDDSQTNTPIFLNLTTHTYQLQLKVVQIRLFSTHLGHYQLTRTNPLAARNLHRFRY